MTNSLRGLIALLAIGWLAPPAAAAWLVMTDGSRVETAGPWEVKGRLVVFTSASGELASLRASTVDLEASEEVTSAAQRALQAAREAAAREPMEESVPQQPILVLTDADVRHVAAEEEEEGTAAGEGSENASDLRLVVADWDQEESPDGDGVIVVGSLRNDGKNVATSIQLQVQVLNGRGEIAGTTAAVLTASSLGSGDVLNFRAPFPELVGFDTARFDITARQFRPAPPPTRPEDLSAEEALRDRGPEPAADSS